MTAKHHIFHSRTRGLTLVEATICSVIVGVMLVAAMQTIGAAARAQRVSGSQNQGFELASVLLSEILSQAYQEPGSTNPSLGTDSGEGPSDRSNWDDVDDYANFNPGNVKNRNKVSIANYSNWSWKADVVYADPTSPNMVIASDQGLKRITVTVTDPQGRTTVLVALRCKNSLYDLPPASTTKFVDQVGVSLQLGGDSSSSIIDGVNLLNPVPAQ